MGLVIRIDSTQVYNFFFFYVGINLSKYENFLHTMEVSDDNAVIKH